MTIKRFGFGVQKPPKGLINADDTVDELELRVKEQLFGIRQFVDQTNDARAVQRTIGNKLVANILQKIRDEDLIDQGRLFGSINRRFRKSADQMIIEVGSFGVAYARAYEFGFKENVPVRAHIRAGIPVRAHIRLQNVAKRPYVFPALRDSQEEVLEILRAFQIRLAKKAKTQRIQTETTRTGGKKKKRNNAE